MPKGWLERVGEWVPSTDEAFPVDGAIANKRDVDVVVCNRYAALYDLVTALPSHADALNELGCIWLEGRAVVHNWPLARALFVAAARHGSSEALLNLGHMHWHGKGVPANERKGLGWYHFAANRGLMDGLCELGHAHSAFAETGSGAVGTEMHIEKAYDCYLSAAQEGHREAMCSLGQLLLDDRIHLRDEARGLYWLMYAAALGDPSAAGRIAAFFDEARMGPPDPGNLLRDFWQNYRRQRDAVAESDQFEQGSRDELHAYR